MQTYAVEELLHIKGEQLVVYCLDLLSSMLQLAVMTKADL